MPGVVAPSVGAMLAAFAAAHALAQPAMREPGALRPGFEDTDDPSRTPRRELRRPDRRPIGTLQNFESAGTAPTYGNRAGSGAGKTGFVSTNTKRRPPPRKGASALSTSRITQPAPLSLAPSSVSATASLPASTTPGASGAPPPAAAVTPATAPPRKQLVRIPDGTPTGGIANVVSTNRISSSSATLLRRRTSPEEDAFAQLGMRMGAFLVLPAVEITGGYDTNPARSPGGRPSTLLTISPELLARSDWQRHEITATLRGSYTAYGQTPELNRPSFDGKITGRLDVTRDTAVIGEGTLVVGTDNPGSPNVQAGLTRFPIFTTLGASGGLQQRFNRLEVIVKGTAERTEFQDSEFTDGTAASNADRNFNRYAMLMRTSYDLMPGIKPFVEATYDTREHDLQFDSFGIQRDSVGWTAKAGTSFEFSRKLTGEVALGYLQRDYKDPSLQQLQGVLFDAALIYSMSALTNIKLTAATTAGETTVPGTSGILTRNAGIEVNHAFRRWLIGTAKFNYGYDDYVGSPRKDDRYSVSAAITYKLNRMMQAKAEIRHEWLHSTVPGVDYTASVFLLGLRLQR